MPSIKSLLNSIISILKSNIIVENYGPDRSSVWLIAVGTSTFSEAEE